MQSRVYGPVQSHVRNVLWVLVLAFVPFTTPPFVHLGTTVAKPLSAIPAFIALGLIVLTRKSAKGIFNKEILILLCFALYALVTGIAVSMLEGHSIFKGLSPMGGVLRGFVSVVFGIGFYAVSRSFVKSNRQLVKAELIVSCALSVSILIAVIQFASYHGVTSLQGLTSGIEKHFVQTSTVWTTRYNGLAYEPSWLAAQVAYLLLPISISHICSDFPLAVVEFKRLRIRVEWVFLFIGFLGIAVAGSRTGIASTALIVAVALFTRGPSVKQKAVLLVVCIVSGILLKPIAVSASYVTTTFSVITTSVQKLPSQQTTSQSSSHSLHGIDDFMSKVHAGPRLAALEAGWDTYLQHPIAGVGIGNSARFFPENAPAWAIGEPEVKTWINPSEPEKGNPKNLGIRILAETGTIGFILFVWFLWRHVHGRSLSLRFRMLRNVGITAILINSLSLDTFSLPSIWILLALFAASKQANSVNPNQLVQVKESGLNINEG